MRAVILLVSAGGGFGVACKRAPAPAAAVLAQSIPSPSPCAPTWNRLPGTFSFQKLNEFHTARVFAFGCAADVTALPDADWRTLMAFFREVADEKQDEWPFRACGKEPGVAPLTARANRRLGRSVFSDLCFEVTAHIP
jgi:hypothetical protein